MRAILATLILLASSPVMAHAMLEEATPPVGSTVQTAPAAISLNFSEAVEPRFSKVAVTGADGAKADQADLHTSPGDAHTLVLDLKPLLPGTYFVTWHAVSVDTHKTQGTYHFTVGAP
jgi:methionine-rich copper-binding protein CopC